MDDDQQPTGTRLPLRTGITGFVLFSLLALASLRAFDYWSRTHGEHAVPVQAADAALAYGPAVVLCAAAAVGIVYLVVRRRRGGSGPGSGSEASRS
jgi:hypothetical protein